MHCVPRRTVLTHHLIASLALSCASLPARISGPAARQARSLIDQAGVRGGVVVHIDCGDGSLTARLRVNERFRVEGLTSDAAAAQRIRGRLLDQGAGGAITVRAYDGRRLPYVDSFVNLIIAPASTTVPRDEIVRVLAPGGVALLGDEKIVKRRPDDIDEWTHFLHGPDNNAVAADRRVDMPRSIQWASAPRWGRSHEEMASMSGAVTSQERVFFIVDEAPLESVRFPSQWKLVARDAFNGTLLWKRDISAWSDHLRHFRSGPANLPRRLVAVGDRVFVTLGIDAPVSALNAATGATVRTYPNTERTEEIIYSDGVLYLGIGSFEMKRRGGGLFQRGEPKPTDHQTIAAIEAETGRARWRRRLPQGEALLPLTLAVVGDRVYYQSTFGVVCLDARNGMSRWRTPRPTPAARMSYSAPTLVVAGGVVLDADRVMMKQKGAPSTPAEGPIEWIVNGWNEPGFPRRWKSELRAYDAETGRQMWSVPCNEGYNSPVDVMVVGDTVWVGSDFKSYDLKTGELKQSLRWKGAPVAMAHHRCYRDKATTRMLLTGRAGVEVVPWDKGWQGNNSWIRGTCQYGVMPANGLIYAPPDACACFPKVKVAGFFAAAPQRGKDGHMPFDSADPLHKGPAYDSPPASGASADAQWTTYRHDPARSGFIASPLPAEVERAWRVKLGEQLTQPMVAGGRLFVADSGRHVVHCLDARTGVQVWRYIAGGRIDSSPTWYRGRVYFGSADGWVCCLRASDGALVWRFRAAPREQMVQNFDQLECVWPVHGSVLIVDDTLYCTAGRSTYLDGGIVLYRLDPITGKQLSRTIVSHLDPDTGKQIGYEGSRGFDMEGATSDLLSSDGESVFMKQLRFDMQGRQVKEGKPHLFAITGFLGEEWFVRSYWVIAPDVAAGWGGWARAGQRAPFGRILSCSADKVYGYGRQTIASGRTGHRADAYHLYASPMPTPQSLQSIVASRRGKTKGKGQRKPPEKQFLWSDKQALMVRAMVGSPQHLAIAGPPDPGEKLPDILAFANPKEALDAFYGKKGSFLQIVSTEDGKVVSQTPLAALPVFDGMSAAGGRLYVAMRDGSVACYR